MNLPHLLDELSTARALGVTWHELNEEWFAACAEVREMGVHEPLRGTIPEDAIADAQSMLYEQWAAIHRPDLDLRDRRQNNRARQAHLRARKKLVTDVLLP